MLDRAAKDVADPVDVVADARDEARKVDEVVEIGIRLGGDAHRVAVAATVALHSHRPDGQEGRGKLLLP